jgi:hypothetical protein
LVLNFPIENNWINWYQASPFKANLKFHPHAENFYEIGAHLNHYYHYDGPIFTMGVPSTWFMRKKKSRRNFLSILIENANLLKLELITTFTQNLCWNSGTLSQKIGHYHFFFVEFCFEFHYHFSLLQFETTIELFHVENVHDILFNRQFCKFSVII